MRFSLLFLSCFLCSLLFSQSLPQALASLEDDLTNIDSKKEVLLGQIEATKLAILHQALVDKGLPALAEKETIIHHSAYSLVYSEEQEQAKWVAHIISPDILNGRVSRTNDFRSDPLVKTGTAIEEDYFLRIIDETGKTTYDGFGYDRGHLAPSADFRWSAKALSESYFYSNIAPQHPDFNRKIWADLENLLRAYVYANKVPLLVVTGGVLNQELPVIERGIHKVAIPQAFWKVVVDLENKQGIGFLIPNTLADYPIEYYALSIDAIEKITAIDFYPALSDALESQLESQKTIKNWLPTSAKGDVWPLPFENLPTKHYNTIVGKKQVGTGTKVHICGTVVRARTSRKGNVILNLDKAWPNEVFNIFINKKNIINFAGNPVKDYVKEVVCAYGEVSKIGKTPTIFIVGNEELKLFSINKSVGME